MYYTDITNEELKYFHNRPVHNFTAKLTDVLSSDLFKVEEIITDSIYKIYPLFYTNEITSSNSNDRILDNKVIICQKTEDETYLTFKSNDGEIIDFTDYGTYYNIGDSLTMAQFNAYISLLRQNITHSDEIHIKDTITGTYGTYQFDISNATIVDSGMIITDETIRSQPKVKLTNPVFIASKYILKLEVLHYTGVNVFDGDKEDFIVKETLEIPLIIDEWVEIPVEDLEEDYIISLNATVTINHNENIIRDIVIRLFDLVSDKDIVQKSEVYNLSVKAWDSVAGVEDQTVEFLQFNPLLFYFEGCGGFEVDGWNVQVGATLTSDSTGSVISANGGTAFVWANLYNTSTHSQRGDYYGDVVVDLDVISAHSSSRLDFYEDTSLLTPIAQQSFYLQTGHNRVVKIGDTFEHFVDGVSQGTVTKTIRNPYRIGILTDNGTSVKFKNFIIGGY